MGRSRLCWGLELGKAMIISKKNHYLEMYGNHPPFIYVESNSEILLRNAIDYLDNNEDKIISLGKQAREWSLMNHTSSEYINTLWKNHVKKIH